MRGKRKGVVCIEGRRQMRPIFAPVIFSYFHFCESGWQYGGRQRRNKCKTAGANESSVTNLRCEDGNVVELSLFNEITRPFSTNEAHLGCSRPSSERHKISPSYFDYIDKTDKNPNLKRKIIFLAPKHRLGVGGVTFIFFFFWRAQRNWRRWQSRVSSDPDCGNRRRTRPRQTSSGTASQGLNALADDEITMCSCRMKPVGQTGWLGDEQKVWRAAERTEEPCWTGDD